MRLTRKELEKKYPDCFKPIKLRVQSVVRPINRPSMYEWFAKIYNYEFWKNIEGYNGKYKVSNYGRVMRYSDGFIYKNSVTKKGYLRVSLGSYKAKKSYLVHRLVAQAFIPNNENMPQINHIDEIKDNNFVENLEWCDNRYNCNYGDRVQRIAKKTKNGKCSKKVIQLDLDGNIVKRWVSISEAGRDGYLTGEICKCCKDNSKTHKKHFWRYDTD